MTDDINKENRDMKWAIWLQSRPWFKGEEVKLGKQIGEEKKMAKVFMGGTCGESVWRQDLVRMLKPGAGYFDPVVEEWNEEAMKNEIKARETYEYVLYWITPEIRGVYSIAEVVDDSNKRPHKTLFGFEVDSCTTPGLKLDIQLVKSLTAVGKMVELNGGRWFRQLFEVAEYLNKQ